MTHPPLKNPPLIEVVFTMRWALQQFDRGARVDPGFDLALGQFYGLVKDSLPRYKKRPVHPYMPTIAQNYMTTARFEPETEEFPLYQLGSGIFTANEAGKQYDWESYQGFVCTGAGKVQEAYEAATGMADVGLVSLSILYVNEFMIADFDKDLKFSAFVSEHLSYAAKPDLVPDTLKLKGQDLEFTFEMPDELGDIFIRISDDSEYGAEQIVHWEVEAETERDGLTVSSIDAWMTDVHVFTHDIFTKMVSPKLRAHFDR